MAGAVMSIVAVTSAQGESGEGAVPYDRFESPAGCADCHSTLARQHASARVPDRAVPETFTWTVPDTVPVGELVITGTVYYSRLVSSVAKHLGVPAEEAEPVEVCREVVRITVS